MTISSKIDPEHNIIIRTASGELSADDIRNAFNATLEHTDFRKEMNVIWDLEHADLSKIAADDLIKIVELISKASNQRGSDYKIAIVASKDLTFGLSRMFEGYGVELPTSIMVYRDLESAYHWINSQE